MHVCAGPCLYVELPDGAPAVIRQLFGRVHQEAVRQEDWAHASVMLNTPGLQQGLRQQLQAAGYWHYMCDPVPGDNRVLLLPCAAPVRGLGHYWVPFGPQLSGTPCLTRECNVDRVYHGRGFHELHITPPLVYNYEAAQQPGTPEWQRDVLELVTHSGRNRRLQLRIQERRAPFPEATLQLGPYLLVHGVAVDFFKEHRDVAPLDVRFDIIKGMARAFKVRAAVRRIEAAFKRWKWRKEIAWNPNTALGRRLLQRRAEAGAAE